MKKIFIYCYIIAFVLILSNSIFLVGCSDDASNSNTTVITPTKEYYWDSGVRVVSTNVSYYVNYTRNLGGRTELFGISIYNNGSNPTSLNPLDCTITNTEGQIFSYNSSKTYSQVNYLDCMRTVNPTFSYHPTIAFDLPLNWQTEHYKFLIEYNYGKYVTLKMENKPSE